MIAGFLPFFLGALALTVISGAILLPALLRPRKSPSQQKLRAMQNIHIARKRLEELELSGDDDAARAEIELALLDDLEGGEGFDDAHVSPAVSASPAESTTTSPSPSESPPPKTPGKFSAAVILALLPLFAAGIYFLIGTPAALTPRTAATNDSPSLDTLLAQLENKLVSDPANADGWLLAAQTYMRIGRFADAARAYRALHRLHGDDANILAAWADAEVMANSGGFTDETRARVQRALALRPEQTTALWLAALDAESRAQPQRALEFLQRLQPLLQNDEQARAAVADFTGRMRRLIGDATPREITVQVRLAPEFIDTARPGDTLYVFAKAINGPPQPIAVSRHRAAEFPLTVTLNDASAMTPDLRLSAFERVSLRARLSRSGEAFAQPGDIESAEVVARTDSSRRVELVIGEVVGE